MKVTLKIKGIHCTSCAMTIDGAIEDKLEGVHSSMTNYAKQICTVDFDEKKTNLKKILEIIKKAGYEAIPH